MKICPECAEEFLESIEICTDCKKPLVNAGDFVARSVNTDQMTKEELFQQEMLAFVEGSLGQCREVEKALLRAQVSCAVYPMAAAAAKDPGAVGVFGDLKYSELKYVLLIKESDVERAKAAMEGKFHDDVIKEGQGHLFKGEVHLDNDEVTCPACGETGTLDNGDCRICGLHLAIDPDKL